MLRIGPSLIVLATIALAAPAAAQTPQQITDAIKGLAWREIGPANMGGRVSAIEGVPGNPRIFWVGGADGGVFKTVNAGTTFETQFVDQPVYSVGSLTLAPSDHNVLWLGSGEGDPRNSTSYGNGVYRSTDGGTTWTYLGLNGTERIKRIAVDPRNADVAWVCAMGHAWGPNAERGVFRTRDGGRTWSKVLFIDQDTGCSDIDIDASNPRVLYAGMWTFRRRPWRFDDGGKQTALYKSTDGGDTWNKLGGRGMPTEPMARIGVSVSRSHPHVVYMITETPTQGTLFRSDDAGASWRMVHEERNINFRPFYYSDVRVDPTNPEVVWSLSGGLYKSTDGGRTFESVGRGIHGDHQALWIDPHDADRVLSGSDGGYQVSMDGGTNWDIINNVTLSQFYQIAFDYQEPYNVCGGLQDNGVWCGPSMTTHGAILKDDWVYVSGGDGFYALPVLDQPWLIYTNLQGGVFMITDMRSGATRRVHPYPNRIGSAGDAMLGHKYRFNWDAPIHISPHDPRTVYIGGNHVFKSVDNGHTWTELSPDLTTKDTTKQLTSGGEVYQDNTAAEFHTTILTIAESRRQPGVIWVGTDDGKVWITRNGGQTWTDITRNIRGLPAFAWVAKIDASHHDPGTAYIAVDQHRMDDFTPHVYRVTEFGARSEDLSAGLPQDDYVKVIREDPRNANLLYVGMERGLFATWDGGRQWVSIRNGLPPVSVRDIQVHPRDHDLIIGTHGRGVYILDDIRPLQELGSALAADAHVFQPRPAIRWETGRRDAASGQREYRAENPPFGAMIYYYLRAKPDRPVVITIKDGAGATIRTLRERDAQAGVNRAVWNLRAEGPERPAGQEGGFGFGGAGPWVIPGEYTVAVRAGTRELTTSVTVRPDPRVDVPHAFLVQQWDAAIELRGLVSEVNGLLGAAESLEQQITSLVAALHGTSGDGRDELTAACNGALKELERFKDWLTRPPPRMGYRQAPRLREELLSLMNSISSTASRPTEAERMRLAELKTETAEAAATFNRFLESTISGINNRAGSYPRIIVDRPIP